MIPGRLFKHTKDVTQTMSKVIINDGFIGRFLYQNNYKASLSISNLLGAIPCIQILIGCKNNN